MRAAEPNPLTDLLTRAEWAEPAFDAADVAPWPPGTVERFVGLELLAPLDPVPTFACDACGADHVERVRWLAVEGAAPRAYIPCPEEGRVWVNPAALRRWAVRAPALAHALAPAVGASGAVTERVQGRVWKLGAVRAGGRVWVALLAVGLARPDAAAVVEAVPEVRAPNALVFVPATVPPDAVWAADRAPVVVALTDLLALGPTGLTADRELLASAVTPSGRPVPKGAGRSFPIPPGTAWEQVALTVEEHHVRVQVGEVLQRFGFAEAGFGDDRADNAPDQLWTLLGLLARRRGTLGTGDAGTTKPGKLKQKVGALRTRLRALVGIESDPFHKNRKGEPYRARFAIRADNGAAFPTPPGATWDDVSLTETADGIGIAVTADTRGVGSEFDDEGTSRRVGTVETRERHSSRTLADLGLTEPDGTPTPAGAALVALLRARGRLKGRKNTPGLIVLGKALTRFFGIDDPPFTFDPTHGMWVARFEAESVVPPPDRS